MEFLLTIIVICLMQIAGLVAIALFANKSMRDIKELIQQMAIFKKSRSTEDVYDAFTVTQIKSQNEEEKGEADATKEELYSANELPDEVREAIRKNM